MTEASTKSGSVWPVVLARFEQHAPASVMARTALEYAFPPDWVDAVFEATRQRQYARELLFSTVVELMTLVSLGLRPSACGGAPEGHAAGVAGLALRQGQPHRAGHPARLGAGRGRVACAGDGGFTRRPVIARL